MKAAVLFFGFSLFALTWLFIIAIIGSIRDPRAPFRHWRKSGRE